MITEGEVLPLRRRRLALLAVVAIVMLVGGCARGSETATESDRLTWSQLRQTLTTEQLQVKPTEFQAECAGPQSSADTESPSDASGATIDVSRKGLTLAQADVVTRRWARIVLNAGFTSKRPVRSLKDNVFWRTALRAKAEMNGIPVSVIIDVSDVKNHRRSADLSVRFTPTSCIGIS